MRLLAGTEAGLFHAPALCTFEVLLLSRLPFSRVRGGGERLFV